MHARQQRLLLLLAVVLGGLAALITWVEPPDPAEAGLENLVDVSEDQLSDLVLETDQGRLVAERTDGGWLLVEPRKARADDQAIQGIVGLLDRLRTGPVLEGLDPAIYGLSEPQARLTLNRTSGPSVTLLVGTKAPVGFRTYVQLDDGGIRLAEGDPMTTLGRPHELLRDRTVHLFAQSAVTGLQWQEQAEAWEVHRRENGWFLKDGRRASTPRVDGVLAALAALRFETFQDDLQSDEIQGLGLTPPQATLTVNGPGGEATLAIGGERAGGVVVRAPDGTVGTLGDVTGLVAPSSELLEDRVLPVRLSDVLSISVTLGDTRLQLTAKDGEWFRNGEAGPAAQTHAVDLLTQLVADRSRVWPTGTATGDHLEVSAGSGVLQVVLVEPVEGGRLAWSDGEPAFLIPGDSMVILGSVAGSDSTQD